MEERIRQKSAHRVIMTDRNVLEMTGIDDVVSFDPGKVVLLSECGQLTVKGSELHVKRLSVEKGELDIEGKVESLIYSSGTGRGGKGNKSESIVGRLLG